LASKHHLRALTVDLFVGEERAIVGRGEHEDLRRFGRGEGKKRKEEEVGVERKSRGHHLLLLPFSFTLSLFQYNLFYLFVLAVGQDQVSPEGALLGASLLYGLEAAWWVEEGRGRG